MRFITDKQAAKLPTLVGAPPEERNEIVADATAIYQHVQQHAWITEAALRTWAEGQGMTPERVTRAINLLGETDRLYGVEGVTPATEVPLELEDLPMAELRELAKEKGISASGSTKKSELIKKLQE